MPWFDSEWESAVAELKAKAAEFTDLYDRAVYSTPQTPELARTRDRVVSTGEKIKATIQQVTGAIDAAYAKAQSVFGSDTNATLEGLGVVWFIPVAVITGAVGGVTYGIKQLRDYLSENDQMERLAAEGYSTEQSLEIMRRQQPGIGPSIERGLKTLGPWIAVGAAMYFFTRNRLKL